MSGPPPPVPHAVDQGGALLVGERDGTALLAHDIDEAGQFGGLFAARGKHGQQCGDFDFRHFAGQDLAQHAGGLFAGECGAVFGQRFQQVLEQVHVSIYGNGVVPVRTC